MQKQIYTGGFLASAGKRIIFWLPHSGHIVNTSELIGGTARAGPPVPAFLVDFFGRKGKMSV